MKALNHSTSAIKDANWASQLIESISVSENINIRLLHYYALTQPEHRKPDGNVYENTTEDLTFLCNACEKAIHFKLIPCQIFIHDCSLAYPKNILTPNCEQWAKVFKRMFDRFCCSYVQTMVSKTMLIHVEIWLENSLSTSLIKPTAQKYNINFITSTAPISISSIFHFTRRIANTSVPIRILHLSDYDPDCIHLPNITARKTMMMIDQFLGNNKVDIKLQHLMLTPDQCAEFELPTMLASRKIELNAMEAHQPDYIRQTLEQHLNQYIDLQAVNRSTINIESAVKKMLPQFNEIIDNNRPMTETVKQAKI